MLNATYQVNSPDVVHETIDGEVVMVNLSNGTYYSMDGVGAEIWRLFADGVAVNRVVDTISSANVGEADFIQRSILELAEKLCNEHLLVPGPATADQQLLPELSTALYERAMYVAPVLQKYTDMEELLLVDPIHDTIEAGWPHTRNDAEAE